MKKSIALTSLLTLFFLLPALLSAQVTAASAQQGLTTFAGIITTFNNTIVKALGTLFMSASVVAFFYGIVQYVWGIRGGKIEAINAGKEFMIWALLALFVMFSVYGIIKFFQKIVPGLDSTSITIPNVIFEGSAGGGGTAGSGAVGGAGTGGGTAGSGGVNQQQTVYTCPDGITKYYNQSDYTLACTSRNSITPGAGGATNINTGGDCIDDNACSGGNVCINFTCQPPTTDPNGAAY